MATGRRQSLSLDEHASRTRRQSLSFDDQASRQVGTAEGDSASRGAYLYDLALNSMARQELAREDINRQIEDGVKSVHTLEKSARILREKSLREIHEAFYSSLPVNGALTKSGLLDALRSLKVFSANMGPTFVPAPRQVAPSPLLHQTQVRRASLSISTEVVPAIAPASNSSYFGLGALFNALSPTSASAASGASASGKTLPSSASTSSLPMLPSMTMLSSAAAASGSTSGSAVSSGSGKVAAASAMPIFDALLDRVWLALEGDSYGGVKFNHFQALMLPIFDSSLRVPSEWTDLVRDLIAASERAQLQPAAPTPSSSLKAVLDQLPPAARISAETDALTRRGSLLGANGLAAAAPGLERARRSSLSGEAVEDGSREGSRVDNVRRNSTSAGHFTRLPTLGVSDPSLPTVQLHQLVECTFAPKINDASRFV